MTFIILQPVTGCKIIQTKEVRMTPEDTKRVFGDELNTEAIHQGI